MNGATAILLKGTVLVEVRDPTGRVVETRAVRNRIVDSGIDLLCRLLVSSLINDAEQGLAGTTAPIMAIGLGIGPVGGTPVQAYEAAMAQEWKRQRIESVELARATAALLAKDAQPVVRLWARDPGSPGNRIHVRVNATTAPYEIEVMRDALPGKKYQAGAPGALVKAVNDDPAGIVKASLIDPGWAGDLKGTDVYLKDGGNAVTVSATFSNGDVNTVAISEAALFTTADSGGLMFNLVHFPAINIDKTLDITFRWKISFSEASGS